jgi:hypothetical protein
MADINTIEMKDDIIIINLKVSKDEYNLLKHSTKKLLLLPTELFDESLTTGKLGNSNRIMLSNKILEKYNVTELLKKAPSKIVELNGEKFLLIKLQERTLGKPIFGEEK